MSRFRVLKNSLLGGQISRDAVGRTDLPQYAHACETLQNMVPILSGGAYRRPGTIFQDYVPGVAATTDLDGTANIAQSSPPRLFPFVVSNQEAYAIIIGVNRYAAQGAFAGVGGAYMKYVKATGNAGLDLTTSYTSYGILPYRAKSADVAATGTDEAYYTRQGGPGAVANTGSTATGPVTILDVADSLQVFDDDIWSVQFCQADDVMFLTHPDYPPQLIYLTSGFSGNQPVAIPYNAINPNGLYAAQSRPYLNQNATAATLSASWTGGGAPPLGVGTITCSVDLFDPLHAPRSVLPLGLSGAYQGLDGAIFAIASGEGSDTGAGGGMIFAQVTSVIDAKNANVFFLPASDPTGIPSSYSKGAATTSWWESAWSNFRGWPRSCAIYQQRLVMASTIHQPNANWFTSTNGFGAPSSVAGSTPVAKFSALGDGPNQGITAGAEGTLANGRSYSTPHDWVYYPVDDSQGDGQSTGPLGSQPFRISLATTSLDAIQYLSPDQQLFVGSATQEWIVAPANGSFDVANSECTIQSHYGSDNVQAIRIGYEMMFVLQNKLEVRAYQYNYFDQSFFGEPVQLFFDEFPVNEESTPTVGNAYAGRKKYRNMDWDLSRSTLWCVDTAGNLFGLTRDRKLSVTTWTTHQLGGFDSTHGAGQEMSTGLSGGNLYTDSAYYHCDGSVASVCSLPNPLSGIRDVWVIVKRSFGTGNANIWSVERMVGANTVRQSAYSTVFPGNAQEPVYIDEAVFLTVTATGDPTSLIYKVPPQFVGLTLKGTYYSETWGIFSISTDGPVTAGTSAYGLATLESNLPPDYGTSDPHLIILGLPYSSVIKPVRPDMPSAIGTAQGTIRRPSKAYVRVFKTMQFKMGAPPTDALSNTLENVTFPPGATLGQSPEIYTGDQQVFLPTTYDRDGYVYILQDEPLPFTFVSLSIEGAQYDQ